MYIASLQKLLQSRAAAAQTFFFMYALVVASGSVGDARSFAENGLSLVKRPRHLQDHRSLEAGLNLYERARYL
ncbi:hypothetical protein DFP72DRAFT_910973 [Ephemerocybe angulata]|uniref:Uncharacterized protein n=1 Tax=Ephemerocybe angulata TaxID=980116 RepID=A0A8H6HPM4_9AGAR|nr:hypothetical protein DFP72DRAFT_910973 [Tulosesus angulatus]